MSHFIPVTQLRCSSVRAPHAQPRQVTLDLSLEWGHSEDFSVGPGPLALCWGTGLKLFLCSEQESLIVPLNYVCIPKTHFLFLESRKAQGTLSHRVANHLGLPRTVLVLVLKVPCLGGHLSPRQLGPVGHPMSRSGGRGHHGTGASAPASGCPLVPSIWLPNLPTTEVHGRLS